MITWMRHEQHGRMPAYGREEVERAQSHGWHVETEDEHMRLVLKLNGAVVLPQPVAPVSPPEEEYHEPIPEEAERAQLYALAEQRGIRVDRRWGLERLRLTVGA